MSAMSWGEVELEPEVRDWYLSLGDESQARASFHVDRLAELGPLLDEPHTRQLDGKLRELRFYLEGKAVRVTYWIAPGRRIILLTVFPKTQRRERGEVERAKRAMEKCMRRRGHRGQRRMKMTAKHTTWSDLKQSRPLSAEGRAAYEDEARIAAFRELAHRLRTGAGLTQAELAERIGTTQSADRVDGRWRHPTNARDAREGGELRSAPSSSSASASISARTARSRSSCVRDAQSSGRRADLSRQAGVRTHAHALLTSC